MFSQCSLQVFCCFSFLKLQQHQGSSVCLCVCVFSGKWFWGISGVGIDIARWPVMQQSRFNLVLGTVKPQIEICRLIPAKSLLYLWEVCNRVIFGVWKIWVIPCGLHIWGISTVTAASGLLLRPGAWSSQEAAGVGIEVAFQLNPKRPEVHIYIIIEKE